MDPTSGAAAPGRERARAAGQVRPLRIGTFIVCLLAGVLLVASALTARGVDLRPTRTQDLAGLVAGQAEHNREQADQVAELRAQVAALAAAGVTDESLTEGLAQAEPAAGLTAVAGPAVRVSLTDAPLSVRPDGVAEELLVVHQQDIQQVVNAMWRGGAEAMTIQGQRVVSSTAVKCVGNTVVLHGVPYAPPYVITAIGDQAALEAALHDSPGVRTYRQYATAYQLGYSQQRVEDVTMPAFTGRIAMAQARAAG